MVGLAVSGEPQTVSGGFLVPKPQESLKLVSVFYFPPGKPPVSSFHFRRKPVVTDSTPPEGKGSEQSSLQRD